MNGTVDTMESIYDMVANLQTQVAALTTTVNNLSGNVTTLTGTVNGHTTDIANLKRKPIAANTDLFTLGVGSYYIPSAAVCATLTNKPVTSNATAHVDVLAGGDEGQLTIYYIPCKKGDASYYQNAHYVNEWGTWEHVNLGDSGWLDLPLNSGISAYSEAQKPRYRRIGKTVYLSGTFKGVAANDTDIAVLPSGYRPSKKVIIPVAAIGQKIDRIEILTDGTIRYNRSTIEPTIAENWHSIACDFSID